MSLLKKKQYKKSQNPEIEDVLLQVKEDRRLLSNVPDKTRVRNNFDRRGKEELEKVDINEYIHQKQAGLRYKIDYDVEITLLKGKKKEQITCKATDISMTGILLTIQSKEQLKQLEEADRLSLKFEIIPGTLPEGLEMKVSMEASIARAEEREDGSIYCGCAFDKPLSLYANKKKNRYMLFISSVFLFVITAFVILMRAESIIYFRFNKWLYLYSIIAAIFLLSRYLFGAFYREIPLDVDFTPGVTILIPCFNEEEWIQRTILSCMNQDYPVDQLEVIVIDDCSSDKSVEKINEIIEKLHNEAYQYETKSRLKLIPMEQNAGKREALAKGALVAKHELVVFVDSDSFLDPFAIRHLVQPFKDPKMGGVAGRTDVANTYTNTLTKMQSVRYYIAFRIMKAAEAYFDAVTCLSGPLACYKKQIIIDNMYNWLNQSFLGQRATFGDDRAMTNFVLQKHRTSYQDSAVCQTIVPNKYKVFLKQQMRWKRSWLRESLIAGKFMYKKEPFAALTFYMGLVVPVFAPIIVLYNFVYVPLTYRIFPTNFLIGLLLMSLLMSTAQLLLRKSSTWIFGMVFCLYYEAVLLWQMPVAWVTFWKSTWGTRMTPSDISEDEKKKAKRAKRERKGKEKYVTSSETAQKK